MVTRLQKNDDPGHAGKEKKNTDGQAETGTHETCRCKETSGMAPRELLRVMLSDLAFWKKANKG